MMTVTRTTTQEANLTAMAIRVTKEKRISWNQTLELGVMVILRSKSGNKKKGGVCVVMQPQQQPQWQMMRSLI